MRIILKYILNNIRERKLRTTVMVLSIILSTTLLFVSLAIGDSYEAAQLKMSRDFAGPASVSVSAKTDAAGHTVWISENEVPKHASIKNKIGFLTSPALYFKDGNYEDIDLIVAEQDALNAINKPRLIDGAVNMDLSGNSIILPEKLTTKYHVKPGDTVTLYIGEKEYQFRLAAVAAYDTVFLRSTRGFNALIPRSTLAGILGAGDRYGKIQLEPMEGISNDKLKSQLASVLPADKYDVSKMYDEAQVASAARDKSIPCYLISFFSLVMSVFIIFSSYKVITMERLPVIGTFRSIGATQRVTTGILMLESLIYGIVGGVVGIPAGCLMLKLMLDGLGSSLSIGIEIPMIISPLSIVLPCFVAMIVSVLSAYVPIRRASRLPVKEVVLGMVEEKNTSNSIRLAFGVVLFVVSVVLPRVIPGDKNEKLLMAAGGLSLLGLMVSMIIIVPLIANILSYVLEGVYGRFLGNEGKLAARNMRQNKNIHQNITLLFISLSAVIVISIVTNFAISYICDVFGGGALNGIVSGDMNIEFIEKLRRIDGIGKVSPIYELDNKVSANGVVFGRMEGVDDLSLHDLMLNVAYEDEKTQTNVEAMFDKDRNLLLSRDCLKQRNLKVGDTVSLRYNGKDYCYKIVASFKSRADNSEAIIPGKYAKSDFGAVNYGTLTFTAEKPDAVIAQIRSSFGNRYNWSRTIEEFYEDTMGIINAFMEPLKKLTCFILLLAVIGIINNLLINYIQKKRSIAMYKSVGLTNRQNVKMTLIEGFTAGLIGAAIGVFISYMEVDTIFIAAGPKISVRPEFDITVFLLTGLAGIIITMLGSVVPILKASKMKLVEEIKFE